MSWTKITIICRIPVFVLLYTHNHTFMQISPEQLHQVTLPHPGLAQSHADEPVLTSRSHRLSCPSTSPPRSSPHSFTPDPAHARRIQLVHQPTQSHSCPQTQHKHDWLDREDSHALCGSSWQLIDLRAAGSVRRWPQDTDDRRIDCTCEGLSVRTGWYNLMVP